MDRREFLTSAGAVAAVSAMMSAGAEVAPERKYRPFLWRDMTCAEFAEAVKATKGVCVVPIGCLEKHGKHLPLATDSIVAHEVCVRAASLEPVIVFPFCPFGRVVEVRHMLGTMAFRSETLLMMLRDLCAEMAHNGIGKIVLYNDHGGNNSMLSHFQRECLEERRPYTVYQMTKFSWCGNQEQEFLRRANFDKMPVCGHADIIETSEMLAISPELVHMDRVDAKETQPLGRLSEINGARLQTSVDWYADFPHQIAGDPTGATAELGNWLLDTWAGNLARAIRLVREDKVTPSLLSAYYDAIENPGTV